MKILISVGSAKGGGHSETRHYRLDESALPPRNPCPTVHPLEADTDELQSIDPCPTVPRRVSSSSAKTYIDIEESTGALRPPTLETRKEIGIVSPNGTHDPFAQIERLRRSIAQRRAADQALAGNDRIPPNCVEPIVRKSAA